jgi:hypothetical protein
VHELLADEQHDNAFRDDASDQYSERPEEMAEYGHHHDEKERPNPQQPMYE